MTFPSGHPPRIPRYPVYIISKGRWASRLTVRALDAMAVPYRVVIEPTELEQYAAVIPRERLAVLPFHDLGQGSIPARNWVWDDAQRLGYARHWILDDNIEAFNRLHLNRKFAVRTGAIFQAAEDFTDRYTNIAISGFNYYSFAKATDPVPAYYRNTRVYSCLLIDTAVPYRWRGRYNEDTDLSLRVLKDGYCTVLFNAFLAGKVTTMRMTGGNTDALYAGDGRRQMAESLRVQHPDCVRVTRKFGRWQHSVDYRPFKATPLLRNPAVSVDPTPNEYGMRIVRPLAPTNATP